MTCELCKSRSGRFNMSARCCQLRYLISMPDARRLEYYEKVQQEQGEEAVQALIAEVKEARKRKRREECK